MLGATKITPLRTPRSPTRLPSGGAGRLRCRRCGENESLAIAISEKFALSIDDFVGKSD